MCAFSSILLCMEYLIVGLGNPGDEYEKTRHNVGRIAVSLLALRLHASEWHYDSLRKGYGAKAITPLGNHVTLLLPETFMNRSGEAVRHWYNPEIDAGNLIVVHDDIDLPQGALKIAYNRGAGGHNGVISIEQTLKTRSFTRVRVGVIPTASGGTGQIYFESDLFVHVGVLPAVSDRTLCKPTTREGVHDFLLRPLGETAFNTLTSCAQRATEATLAIVECGREYAMGEYNRSVQEVKRPIVV